MRSSPEFITLVEILLVPIVPKVPIVQNVLNGAARRGG
jgi:hypothetical protein